ncbi:MAG: disulfide bond formation protein B [Paracoccaceae bacterium]|nr:disulfide bond formation protein B [Paracoccaceae bacterium]
MTARNLMLLAAGGSLALLLGAFIFQAFGFAPCKMCLWQRWPHAAAIGVGALVLAAGPLVLLGLAGALSALVTGGIGVFHSGVEQGWWEGPTSCSGGSDTLEGLTGSDLLSMDAPVNVVLCDEVAWADPVIGLSMATWNAVISFGLAALWIAALRLRNVNNAPQ